MSRSGKPFAETAAAALSTDLTTSGMVGIGHEPVMTVPSMTGVMRFTRMNYHASGL